MRLSYQGMLRCGRPYAGATIRIPASAKIASKVAPTAVRMNGSVVSSVIVNEHVLTIAAPKRIGITCDSLTMGTVTIVLGAGVRIANPARAGSYRLTLTSGSTTRSGAYTVSQ